MKENVELQKKVRIFLDSLYQYDCVGKNAFFTKQEELKFQKFDKSEYQMEIGKKYIWINAPYLKLCVFADGTVSDPKRKHGFIGNINWFLYKNSKLKRRVRRVHTSALRFRGQLGSEIVHYYNLEYR